MGCKYYHKNKSSLKIKTESIPVFQIHTIVYFKSHYKENEKQAKDWEGIFNSHNKGLAHKIYYKLTRIRHSKGKCTKGVKRQCTEKEIKVVM